ncbi:MAG: amino acid ABC transporter permease, partial [Deltaproteobacteria bacterium]|nr:amino acid ABC transporter permease [Deltaproteobacteria bacterium]
AIIVPSAVLGVIIGILVGAGRAGSGRFSEKLLNLYVSVFRGTPLVVQLMMWFYGLPSLSLFLEARFGPWIRPFSDLFRLSPYVASVLGFALCSGAYQSEYIRGAILSIKKGQFWAAMSLGFSKAKTFRHVTLPMAVRRAVPGCGNEIIYLIKYSSLAVIVTVNELTGEAKGLSAMYFRHLECYFLTAVYYLALVTAATALLRKLERKLRLPGEPPIA